MASTLNIRLTDALRRYVDERASDKNVYATPSEYIQDLIRQDMLDRAVAPEYPLRAGGSEARPVLAQSILDLKDED
jgi:antitoxin ParD1/3/4